MGWWKIKSVERGQIDWDASKNGMANQVPGRDDPNALYNGDGPADEMGEALARIARLYKKTWGRWPKLDELQACFNFVTGPARDEGDTYVPNKERKAEQ